MGDPRRLSKKYKKPRKLWDKKRILEESRLRKEFGLKNTREVWIAQAELRKVRREARKLLALPEEIREKEAKRILSKLERLNILPSTATIDDILSLTVRDFLERRLQTIVWRKGLAKTPKQARQLIVHGFISVDGRRVLSPGMLITKAMEDKIAYYKPIQLEAKVVEEETSTKEEASEEEEVENGSKPDEPVKEGVKA